MSIGNNAFMNNTSLSSITFSQGVEIIGRSAFLNTALTEITIGANVKFTGLSFDNGFEAAYNNGKAAGTYTRPNTDTRVWTKQ